MRFINVLPRPFYLGTIFFFYQFVVDLAVATSCRQADLYWARQRTQVGFHGFEPDLSGSANSSSSVFSPGDLDDDPGRYRRR